MLEYITALGAIATPITVAALTIYFNNKQKNIEKRNVIEEKLRTERLEIYNTIIEPINIFLMPEVVWNSDSKNKGKIKNDVATQKLQSSAYRNAAIQLTLLADDIVVKANNHLMQYMFKYSDLADTEEFGEQMIRNLGSLLLAIRKSAGNSDSQLTNLEMLEWMITDIDRLKKK